MPFCPKCRLEYPPGRHRCPDCGADLVDRAAPEATPPSPRHRDVEQVLLCTVAGEIHAKLVQDALSAQGVRSRSQRRGLTHWLGLPTSGGEEPIQIFVNRPDLPLAQSVYDDFERRGAAQSAWDLPFDEGNDSDA